MSTFLKIILFLLFVMMVTGAQAQPNYVRTLESFLDKKKIGKTEVDSINKFLDSSLLVSGTSENLIIQLFRIEKIASNIPYASGLADVKFNIARHYMIKSKTAYAMKYFLASLSISDEIRDTLRSASATQQIGLVYYQQKNYVSALKYFNSASHLFSSTTFKRKQSQCFYLQGIVYRDLSNYDSAKFFFNKAANIKIELKDSIGLTQIFMEFANLYIMERLSDSALIMLKKSTAFSNDYQNDHSFLTRKYKIEAQAYLIKNQIQPALIAANLCLKEAKLNGRAVSLSDAYQICFQVNSKLKRYKEAFEFQSDFLKLKDSLFSIENSQALARIEMANAEAKSQIEINTLSAEKQLREKLNYSFVAGILLLVLLSILLYNRIRTKQRTNNIITLQKNLVEKKNNEITQSINYAKRIQNAILPSDYLIRQNLPNSFILYKPKDIVAGDFYWMEVTGDAILFAACDCTGHGVPGALVSVVCHNALNRAVREFGLTQPAAILNKTADLVIENFSKGQEEIKDGMDISLCSYNTKTKQLEWAGANNPLWIVNKANENNMENNQISIIQDNYQLTEIIADKQSIGHDISKHIYTNHSISINNGDIIYLFTDGFADQFGGPTGQKKLTRKRFKSLLLSIQNNSIQSQGIKLDEFFAEYRNKEEQIDDILVMGIKF